MQQKEEWMTSIVFQNVTLNPDSLRSTLEAIDGAISRQQQMRSLIEQLIGLQEGSGPKSASASRVVRPGVPGRRGRRPAGEKTLREYIHDVLRGASAPMKAPAIRAAVLANGYPTSATPASFATAVYSTLGKDEAVAKGEDGYSLSAAGASGEAKPRRKRGRPRKSK
jgi:hypothetical protein